MKEFVFVSDFDGTLTGNDFYKIISETYLKEKYPPLFKAWKRGEMKDREYLSYVFNNISRTEEEIYQDIINIPLDPNAKAFISKVQSAGGDFIIVSAGTSYYVEKVLKYHDIQGVKVFSNKGVFKDNGIYFDLNEKDEYYSDRYGIDKLLVVEQIKKQYKKVFFAGDSGPDVKPASISDFVFAKGELIHLLKEENIDFVEFKDFSELWDKVKTLI